MTPDQLKTERQYFGEMSQILHAIKGGDLSELRKIREYVSACALNISNVETILAMAEVCRGDWLSHIAADEERN